MMNATVGEVPVYLLERQLFYRLTSQIINFRGILRPVRASDAVLIFSLSLRG